LTTIPFTMANQGQWDDQMAATYRKRQGHLFGPNINDPSILHYLGNIHNKSILDVGCGYGRLCRFLKKNGASKVVGLDISPSMLQYAKEDDAKANINCEYQQGDALDPKEVGQFDFVTSESLIHFAETVDQLKAMCRGFYLNLKPGGKFVGTSLNCLEDGEWGNSFESYDLESFSAISPGKEGKRLEVIAKPNPDGNVFNVILTYYEAEVYERAFKDAGFESLTLAPTIVPEEAIAKFPEGFWDLYMKKPGFICFIAEKK